jgi:S1-C subfamily serine protease
VSPVNAAVPLLGKVLPATVHIQAEIPREHPSAQILGTERMGSGAIIDTGGLILTVNYIVLGAAQVRVTLLDGRTFPAQVLKHDFASGLALLRIDETNLAALPLGRSTELTLGQEVFILASVGQGGARVSNGAISYLGPFDANWEYVLDRAIMTTAMNPGLGGGPLLDSLGRMVGIVSLNLNEIGRFALAVPAEHYLDARDAYLDGGDTALGTRAWLGVFCQVLNNHVVIAGLLPGGPCEQAGLKAGDVILAVDDQDVGDRASLYRRVWLRQPGESVRLKVFRGREVRSFTVASGDVAQFFA